MKVDKIDKNWKMGGISEFEEGRREGGGGKGRDLRRGGEEEGAREGERLLGR